MSINDALGRMDAAANDGQRLRRLGEAAREEANRLVSSMAHDFIRRASGKIDPLPVGSVVLHSPTGWNPFTSDGLGRYEWRPLDVRGWEIDDGVTLLEDARVVYAVHDHRRLDAKDRGPEQRLVINKRTRAVQSVRDSLPSYTDELSLREARWCTFPDPLPWEVDTSLREDAVSHWTRSVVAAAVDARADLFARALVASRAYFA